MEAMRATWTDERMDDLARHMDKGFERVDRRFEQIDRRLERIDERLDREFALVDQKFDRMLQLGGGMIATFVVGFAGLILAQV